jgi:uncharacterized protein (DUF697 family)
MADTTAETSREQKALETTKRYSAWSAGAGLIPVPGLDLIAVTGVQLKMLAEIASIYGVPFQKEFGKELLSGLLGSVLPLQIARGSASALKAVPIIGSLTALLLQPALSGAATYAVGKVFILHFESGGTLLNFEASKVRDHFEKEFEAARAGAGAEATVPA